MFESVYECMYVCMMALLSLELLFDIIIVGHLVGPSTDRVGPAIEQLDRRKNPMYVCTVYILYMSQLTNSLYQDKIII